MATELPDIPVPDLVFLPAKKRKDMTKEEFIAVFDVWMDAGSAVADALDVAIKNRDNAPPGTTERAEWIERVNDLFSELNRLREMGIELRTGEPLIEPPSAETVDAIDKVTREVGIRQRTMVRAKAAVSAVTAALTIATAVHV